MFLEELRSKYPFDNIILHMDNISFHKSGDVKERMDELGFHYTYSVRYMPKYNGVEECINILKKKVKKKRLEMISRNINIDSNHQPFLLNGSLQHHCFVHLCL